MGTASFPETLEEVLEGFSSAGRRLNEMGAVEGGAGNISAAFNWDDVDLPSTFPHQRKIDLPYSAPALAGYTVLVTGSGTRLRDLATNPENNVGAVVIDEGGDTGTLFYRESGNFDVPTSEFNSHLAVHQDQIAERSLPFHAVIHAQPPKLVMLSHIPEYQSFEDMNRAILRWQPETIVQLREGLGYLPFMVPGSDELMENNIESLRKYLIVMWEQHGVMARSDTSPLRASDRIEYAETAAIYEFMNKQLGEPSEGLTDDELRRVIEAFDIDTELYQEETEED